MKRMKRIEDIPVLEKIPVLVRASLNVPVVGGVVEDDFRLRRALATISFLTKHHARVILIGHIGEAGTETLRPVYEAMKKYIPTLSFCPVSVGEVARAAVREIPPGGVLMLENLRRDVREKENTMSFARELASLADLFVQDAFDVCHREHASVVSLPQLLPSYAGMLLAEEVETLTKALRPTRPSLAIIGGAKFSTKEPVIQKLLQTYDHVFVGGALANDFLQQQKIPMEASVVSNGSPAVIKRLLKNEKILLPVDGISAPFGRKRSEGYVGWPKEKEALLDAGPRTTALLQEYIHSAATILWNGPLGNYENGFTDGTVAVAQAIIHAPRRKNWLGFSVPQTSIVGGGDTVDVIERLKANDVFSFISTGGGAMLDFIAQGTLPGIRALAK